MSKFEQMPMRNKLSAVAASTAIAISGVYSQESDASGGIDPLRPNELECIDAATAFPNELNVRAMETRRGETAVIGSVALGRVTDQDREFCSRKGTIRDARLFVRINDEIVPAAVGVKSNRKQELKLRTILGKEQCEDGQAELASVLEERVKLKRTLVRSDEVVKETYISPLKRIDC